MKYDVVVVGGRIGGSVSSLFASLGHLNVLMVEKRQEIGTPVQCAGATSCDTFQTLPFKPSTKYINTEIYGGTICAPNGDKAKLVGDKVEGYILERKIFDKELSIQSARAGTDIQLKTTVKGLIREKGKVTGVVAKHMGKTTDIKADLVIAADGIESNIAQMAGLRTTFSPQDIASCAQYEMVGLDLDPNYLEFYFGKEIAPGGYVWIFPKANDVANVGIGIRGQQKTAYDYLKQFISNLDGTAVEFNIGGVPLCGAVEKTYTDGLIVIGDAAGQVDPLTGGGIHITTQCGKIAGEIAVEAIEREDCSANFLKNYEKRWQKEVGKNINNSLKYRKIMDKLLDEDYNEITKFLQNHTLKSISKLSMFGLIKGHPNLLRLLKDLI